MDKLVIALMIPGSIILCLVAGKRLWIRALAIVVLLLALGIVLPNMQYDRSRVALALQSLFLTEFTKDVGRLIDSGQHQTASLRLAEFNRRFLQDAQEPEKLSDLMADLRRLTNAPAPSVNMGTGSEPQDDGYSPSVARPSKPTP